MAYPKVIYQNQQPEKNSWCRFIDTKVHHKNENFLAGITGPTGVGKTYSALSIAEILKKEFGFDFEPEYIVFSFLELMKLINSGKLKRGSVLVFDEPQISISSKNHQSEMNKVFYQLTSTFRHKGFVLLFCNPFLLDLDKSTRKLFHAEFCCLSKDEKERVVKIKPFFLEWYAPKDDWYRHFLRVIYKPANKSRHVSLKLKRWSIPHPSQELADTYETMKTAFTTALNLKIQNKLEAIEKKDEPKLAKLDIFYITERQKETIEAVIKNNNNVLVTAEHLGVSYVSVYAILKTLRNRGIMLGNYNDLLEKGRIRTK